MNIISISLSRGNVRISKVAFNAISCSVEHPTNELGSASVHVLVDVDGYVDKVLHGLDGSELPNDGRGKINFVDVSAAAMSNGYTGALEVIGMDYVRYFA